MTKEGKGLTVDPNTADAAIEFLRQPHDQPFLLTVSVLNPHDICEYTVCGAFRKMLPDDPALLPPARPEPARHRRTAVGMQKFAAQHADWSELQVARVPVRCITGSSSRPTPRWAASSRNSAGPAWTPRPIVVFTSDHGEMMGSHRMVTKQKLYEESAAVPLIVAPPGRRSRRRHGTSGQRPRCPADAARLRRHCRTRVARRAKPAAAGGRKDRAVARIRRLGNRQRSRARMVRTARYKYVLFGQGENREQFFDMEADPGETKNLIAE